MATKFCTGCRVEKSVDEFAIARARKDGLQGTCKECQKKWRQSEQGRASQAASTKKYRAANPDLVKRWAAAPPAAAKRKEWRERHPEYESIRYLESKEYFRAKHQRWITNNPDRYRDLARIGSARRRARLMAVRSERFSIEEIIERDGLMCQLCGDSIYRCLKWPDPLSLSVDHIVPISCGGDDVLSNVQLAHLGCNLAKGNRIDKVGVAK